MQSQVALTASRHKGHLCQGQSTVEFAIVLAAFLSIAFAFSALWDALKDGLFVQHALQCASHHLSASSLGSWSDVLAY